MDGKYLWCEKKRGGGMKLELNAKEKDMRLLFSNVGTENEKMFYLLMVYHKSMKGGFGYPVTKQECVDVLAKKGYIYLERGI
jgi:hypothetical protein